MLHLKPDMASLATGSVNFAKLIYENTPQLVEGLAKSMLEYNVKPEIEAFDAAMLYNAKNMAESGLLKALAGVLRPLGDLAPSLATAGTAAPAPAGQAAEIAELRQMMKAQSAEIAALKARIEDRQ